MNMVHNNWHFQNNVFYFAAIVKKNVSVKFWSNGPVVQKFETRKPVICMANDSEFLIEKKVGHYI